MGRNKVNEANGAPVSQSERRGVNQRNGGVCHKTKLETSKGTLQTRSLPANPQNGYLQRNTSNRKTPLPRFKPETPHATLQTRNPQRLKQFCPRHCKRCINVLLHATSPVFVQFGFHMQCTSNIQGPTHISSIEIPPPQFDVFGSSYLSNDHRLEITALAIKFTFIRLIKHTCSLC